MDLISLVNFVQFSEPYWRTIIWVALKRYFISSFSTQSDGLVWCWWHFRLVEYHSCKQKFNLEFLIRFFIELNLIHRRPMLFSSLLLISIGNGNIRACITSLGGHQFKLPEQADALNTYFSHYYFMYYMGILLSKIVPPAIRADTQCFGKDECYAAVFGFLASIFLCCWSKFVSVALPWTTV